MNKEAGYKWNLSEHAACFENYKKMGAHKTIENGVEGVRFAVWAPRALAVRLVGDFNEWNGNAHVMKRKDPEGIFQLFVPGLTVGAVYQYEIITQEGQSLRKSDPYGNFGQLRPDNASVVADLESFVWTDERWLKDRTKKEMTKEPVSVYEVYIGSWRKHLTGFYNYREFAHEITEYVKDMGYTHVELMGILEHPYDGSWGYQVTGYFAPTSRYGTPQDFMYMVDYLHRNDIGVILDWVPAHFPKDAHGLAEFDGSRLYEYEDKCKREHPDWGTLVFDHGKKEVRDFLISSAMFWVKTMHVDGLRVDAVASMLYLDYSRPYGQWQPNRFGENKNLEAVEFLQQLTACLAENAPSVMLIAEESTSWPKVTGPVDEEGLGFTFKWNMGWMHDFLDYMKLDSNQREANHHKLTFGMMYAYKEQYMLILSHDEVVHLKGSMLEKMPGDQKEKLANLKTGYAFMIGHPGKKLLFMGQEFGETKEWSEEQSLEWNLLKEEGHSELQHFVKQLLHIYRKYPALYEGDYEPEGFQWMNPDDCKRSVYSFVRKSKGSQKNLLFVSNFSSKEWQDYRVGVPKYGRYLLILDSEATEEKKQEYMADTVPCDGQEYSVAYPLSPYETAVFEY